MQTHIKVSILHGIVMGGGAGASVHGRYRVVTENTVSLDPFDLFGYLLFSLSYNLAIRS